MVAHEYEPWQACSLGTRDPQLADMCAQSLLATKLILTAETGLHQAEQEPKSWRVLQQKAYTRLAHSDAGLSSCATVQVQKRNEATARRVARRNEVIAAAVAAGRPAAAAAAAPESRNSRRRPR